jgi:hypothetical protein
MVIGQVNDEAGELGVLDVIVRPLTLVEPDHTDTPFKLMFFRFLARVAQVIEIESM